jgi:hypothetical protein
MLQRTANVADGSKASKAAEAVRPCTSAPLPKADVNSPTWLPPLSAKTGLVQCSKIALIFSRVLCEGRLNKYHLLPKPARPSMKAEFASRLAAPGKRFQ